MLNTLAGQIFEDFVQPSLKKKTLAEETKSNIIKLIVVVIGLISFGMVFVVENLSGVMELQMALNGFATGPTLAIFTMGIYVPFANSDVSKNWKSRNHVAIIVYFVGCLLFVHYKWLFSSLDWNW